MNTDLVRQKKRQAVIIVDASSQALYPLTACTPLSLLPLANMRVIDYSLYWLASQRFDEIIICCTKFEEELNNYLVNTNWNIENITRSQTHTGRVKSPLIQLLSMPTCFCTGDILRELDARNCIESDSFLLVDSGTISNLDLTAVWAQHEKRQKESSYNIMTSIFSHVPVNQDSLANRELALIHNEDNRILAYNDIKEATTFSVMTTSLLENKKVAVRFDIAQSGIHICSKEVLVHFSDNYDYKDVYDDYLSKEVDNIEFGYCYYVYFNDNAYSRRITDLNSYKEISEDVICRWCYPMVPDNEICGIQVCSYNRNDVYCHPTVKLSYSTQLVKRCLVEYESVVEEDVVVKNSAIGPHCTVKKGCKITNCIIHGHCTIEEGSVLKNCIIGHHSAIGAHCTLDHCVFGSNVTINENLAFDNTRIHNVQYDEELEEESAIQWDAEESLAEKEQGTGYFMSMPCACACALASKGSCARQWKAYSVGCQGFESEEDEEEVDNRDYERLNQSYEFVRRLEQSAGRDLDDIYTEISCFRMSLNCTYDDILNDLVTILLETIWKKEDTIASYLERTASNRHTIRLHNMLITKFLIGSITKQTIIENVVKFAVATEEFRPFFGYLIQQLWDENVVDITSIENWINNVDEEDAIRMKLASDNVLKRVLDDMNDSDSSYGYSSYSYSDSESGSESESESESESGSESESESGSESESESGSESYSNSDSHSSDSESHSESYSGSESGSNSYSEYSESE